MNIQEMAAALRCCADGRCEECPLENEDFTCGSNLLSETAGAVEAMAAELEKLRKAAPGWHRYGAESRPSVGELMWVTRPGCGFPVLAYRREDGEITDGNAAFTPEYWMPIDRPVAPSLPEPPEEEVPHPPLRVTFSQEKASAAEGTEEDG